MSVGLLILRLVVGLTLAAHGAQKLLGWFGGYGIAGTGQFLEQLGFRPGRLHAIQAGIVEVVGGLFLAVGLLTPAAAAAVVAGSGPRARLHRARSDFARSGARNLLVRRDVGPGRPGRGRDRRRRATRHSQDAGDVGRAKPRLNPR